MNPFENLPTEAEDDEQYRELVKTMTVLWESNDGKYISYTEMIRRCRYIYELSKDRETRMWIVERIGIVPEKALTWPDEK